MKHSMSMKKTSLPLPLAVLVLALLLLLRRVRCEGSGGGAANITVMGTVFCDACSSSSFSNHSYYLSGVKVRIDCMIKVNSTSKEEIKITAEKTTNNYGIYQLDIPAIEGSECSTERETTESFCRATLLDNPCTLCNVAALTTTVGHISYTSQEGGACLYNLNALYYRPNMRHPDQCGGTNVSSTAAVLDTSLFYCPPWPLPRIPFCTPRLFFPPIPFFTPPPSVFSFPLPPLPRIPFLAPSPPPPAFLSPFPSWPWTPPAMTPPSLFSFPPLPSIFSTPSPPPLPHPIFSFPLPSLPHLPPLPSWFSPPPPPLPPPPPPLPLPYLHWHFPPVPFFPPTPSSSTPSPAPSKYFRKDPSTWPSSHNQP